MVNIISSVRSCVCGPLLFVLYHRSVALQMWFFSCLWNSYSKGLEVIRLLALALVVVVVVVVVVSGSGVALVVVVNSVW